MPIDTFGKYKVKDVFAEHDRTAVILETGEVFVWGGEDHRHIGGEFYEDVTDL